MSNDEICIQGFTEDQDKEKTKTPKITDEGWNSQKWLYLFLRSCMAAILDGFLCGPVDRLKKTFAKCDKSTIKKVEEMQKVFSPSHGFKAMRQELEHASGPCLPYL